VFLPQSVITDRYRNSIETAMTKKNQFKLTIVTAEIQNNFAEDTSKNACTAIDCDYACLISYQINFHCIVHWFALPKCSMSELLNASSGLVILCSAKYKTKRFRFQFQIKTILSPSKMTKSKWIIPFNPDLSCQHGMQPIKWLNAQIKVKLKCTYLQNCLK